MSLIRRNREDLNNTTDTDRRSYNFLDYKRSYYKYGTEPNASIVGSFARIENGVASGFSASNSLKLQDTFDTSDGSRWEMVYKVTISNISTYQFINGVDFNGVGISINGIDGTITNRLGFFLSHTAGSWDIGNGYYAGYSTLIEGKTYWIKALFNGAQYRLLLADNAEFENATTEVTVNSTLAISPLVNMVVGGLGNGAMGALPFLGTIDLSQSYIKINGERWWSGDSYNKVGSWIEDGIVSGFTTSNYLKLPTTVSDYNNLEVNIKIKASSLGTLCDCLRFENGGVIFLHTNNYLGYDPANVASTLYPEIDTWYYIKFTHDGSTYTLSYSLDGGEYIDVATSQSTTKSTGAVYVGGSSIQTARYWRGSIDLTQSYIKINNKDWWHGTKAVKVPSSSITDFGGTKYFKNVVITKYWKEITTGSRELEYACYAAYGGTYYYAKSPLGSDMTAYFKTGAAIATSSSELTKTYANYYQIVTEDNVQLTAYNYGLIYDRYSEGDLYIDTTTTTVVEGTPEDYTYTTEESSIIEVTAEDDYDFTELIPSDDFDYYLDSRIMYNLIKRGTREYYKRELSQRDTGTYTFTLGRTYVAELLFVGNGGGGSSSQRSSRWYYTGGGSGAVFEGKVILPPDTYTLTIGTLGYSYNIDNVAGHSNGLQSTDSFLVNSSGEELIRVGAGKMGTGTGSGGAAGVLTLGSLDIVSTKKAKNGNAGGSGSSNNFALSAYDNTKTGYGAGTGSVRYAGNVYGIAGIFDLVLQTDIDNYDWYKDVGTKIY